ncbi:MAG TPA: hypothetical protein PLX85_05410, partial [Dehalococcoidia bacterium]|nr:hypothetical protein [Dehalococcoidia bacterium]
MAVNVTETQAPEVPAAPIPVPEIPAPALPTEHPNEAPRLTPVEYRPGRALYKTVLPGVIQV